MTKFVATLLASTVAMIAVPAAAQEEPRFGGVYIGVSGGYAELQDDNTGTVTFDRGNNGSFGETVTTSTGDNAFSPGFCGGSAPGTSPAPGCFSDDAEFEYSARIGADMLLTDNFLLGLVVEGSKTDLTDNSVAFSNTPAFYQFTREIDYTAAVRARAGAIAGPALLYVTGGVAGAKIDNSFTTSNTANTFTENNADDFTLGFQAGGGAELALSPNVSIGLEYLFNRYDTEDYSVTVGQGSAGATNPFVLAGGVTMRPEETDLEWHSARASLNFRF